MTTITTMARQARRRFAGALLGLLATTLLAGAGAVVLPAAPAAAQERSTQERSIVMASTTSTEQSGLFAHLLPAFKRARGIDVRVVALGTGQALDMARRGDADVVFVHDPAAEQKFVAEGFGLTRRLVMYNDFVLIGPASDLAGTRGRDIEQALRRLTASDGAVFISRGDKSGTHAAELRYWKLVGIDDPSTAKTAKPSAFKLDYRACGCGMGPALNMAAGSDAYLLSDRGTWLSFKNRANLALLVEGDRRLFNQYSVIVVNPAKHPHVKTELAQAFSDWVVSPDGQATIASYRIGGEQAFFPNAEN